MMQCLFSTLSSKYNIYCAAKCLNPPYILLNSQRKNPSYNINHIIIDKDKILFEDQELEKQLFNIYSFIQDISPYTYNTNV